jgi:uncharacterized membrane protein YccF (DUF307 family)
VSIALNVIWLVFGGLVLAVGYGLAALVMFLMIFTIPFGIAAARLAVYALWPFGRTVVVRPDRGVASALGNIVWVVLAGWWLALAHLVTGVAMILTIIGIPLGVANLKLIPVAFTPFGKEIVDIEEARRLGLTPEVVVSDQPHGSPVAR